ncbi:hypothetical protein [uncultured Pseudacidovorax sp.]|uniref:helix-turn-helix transcriptional regulator n=1 Tax=uncultured Pseudacidovorax sp. TaxID=679313 RepID=UPI0025E7B391|nr:hypothetical protein [uncultured Pseudacidovorax sp.]
MTDQLNERNDDAYEDQLNAARGKAHLKVVERGIQDLRRRGINPPWKHLMKLVDAPELKVLEAAESRMTPSNEPVKCSDARAQLADLALLRKEELVDWLPIEKSMLDLWLKEGSRYYDPTFPQPFYLNNSRIPLWFAKDIVHWAEAQASKRTA